MQIMLECSGIIVRKLFYSVLLLVDLFGLIKVNLSTGNSISNTEFHFFPRLSGENRKKEGLCVYEEEGYGKARPQLSFVDTYKYGRQNQPWHRQWLAG